MKRGWLAIVPLLIALTLGSCVRPGDISVKDVEKVEMHGFSGADVTLAVENRSGSNVRLQEAKLTLYDGGNRVLDVLLMEEVRVLRKSLGSVTLPLRMKISDPMAALSLVGRLKQSPERFTVSGEAVAKAGWGRKKITFSRVPLEEILRIFGAGEENLLKSFGL